MSMTRRCCVTLPALAVSDRRLLAAKPAYRAIAFDAFTVFDPRPVAARVAALYPDRATRLVKLWRTRQFEYTWLRTITNTYVDFRRVTEESLAYAAQVSGVELTADKRDQLIACFYALPAWPDAKAVLRQLRRSGRRLVFLSNFTEEMLTACIRTSALENLFEHLLSTDRVRAFKPDSRAYRMADEVLGLKKEEVAFAAFAAWDVAGSKAYGYSTFWVNRMRCRSIWAEWPTSVMRHSRDSSGDRYRTRTSSPLAWSTKTLLKRESGSNPSAGMSDRKMMVAGSVLNESDRMKDICAVQHVGTDRRAPSRVLIVLATG